MRLGGLAVSVEVSEIGWRLFEGERVLNNHAGRAGPGRPRRRNMRRAAERLLRECAGQGRRNCVCSQSGVPMGSESLGLEQRSGGGVGEGTEAPRKPGSSAQAGPSPVGGPGRWMLTVTYQSPRPAPRAAPRARPGRLVVGRRERDRLPPPRDRRAGGGVKGRLASPCSAQKTQGVTPGGILRVWRRHRHHADHVEKGTPCPGAMCNKSGAGATVLAGVSLALRHAPKVSQPRHEPHTVAWVHVGFLG